MSLVPEISDEHYAAIGKVASAWSELEQFIDRLCIVLVDTDHHDAVLCLTSAIMGGTRKLEALAALMHLRSSSAFDGKAFDALYKKAQGLSETRNRIVHDPWVNVGLPEGGYEMMATENSLLSGIRRYYLFAPHRVEVSARRKLTNEVKRVDAEELIRVAGHIRQLQDDLFTMWGTYRKARAAESRG